MIVNVGLTKELVTLVGILHSFITLLSLTSFRKVVSIKLKCALIAAVPVVVYRQQLLTA